MRKSDTLYKAMYTACLQQHTALQEAILMQQEHISFQKEQLLYLQLERESNAAILFQQDQLICHQHQLLLQKYEQIEIGRQTVIQLDCQLTQYDNLIKNQEKELGSLQQEISKQYKVIDSLLKSRHELKALKKWLYGIRSEKRPSQAASAEQGLLLKGTLNLGAYEYAVCQLSSRRVIAEHIRQTVVTSPKTRGSRNDLPKGMEEDVITLDVDPLPASAKLVRIDEQRQLACSPLRWYIKVTRRPVYIVASEGGLCAK